MRGLGACDASTPEEFCVKLASIFLLLTGWVIVLAALILLAPALPRTSFVLAGLGVEALGLTLLVRSHLSMRTERG